MKTWTREDLTPFSTWRHIATNSTYTVLGIGTESTNGDREGEERAVYLSHTQGKIKLREVTEFLDGRFQKES